jgi:hypothetical protein
MPQAFSPQMLRRPVGHHHDRKDIGGELLEFGLTEHVVELVVSVASWVCGTVSHGSAKQPTCSHDAIMAQTSFAAKRMSVENRLALRPFVKKTQAQIACPWLPRVHDTIYSWECAGNKARISGQTLTVDPRGFIAENWKRIKQ